MSRYVIVMSIFHTSLSFSYQPGLSSMALVYLFLSSLFSFLSTFKYFVSIYSISRVRQFNIDIVP